MLRTTIFLVVAAVLAAFGAASASAQDHKIKYLGTTTATFDGSQGYFARHRACQQDFGDDAVWCTSQMIIQGGPAPGVPDLGAPQPESAWVNPAPVGAASVATGDGVLIDLFVTDFSVRTQSQPLQSLNCTGWNSAAGDGLVIQQGNNGPTFNNRSCGLERPAACCGVPRRVR